MYTICWDNDIFYIIQEIIISQSDQKIESVMKATIYHHWVRELIFIMEGQIFVWKEFFDMKDKFFEKKFYTWFYSWKDKIFLKGIFDMIFHGIT